MRVTFRNPTSCATILYEPRGRECGTRAPIGHGVVVVARRFVRGCTVTPGSTAPVESVMVPVRTASCRGYHGERQGRRPE